MTRRLGAAFAAALAGASCSVADVLTSGEILEELDEIVSIADRGPTGRIVYAERATLSAWYMRMVLLAPVRGALAWAFGRREVVDLDNPAAHVRELLRELPDEAGRDLAACAATSSRFAWLASLDRNPETRVLAIDGLADVCRQLTIAPFGGPIAELDLSADPAVLARAQAAVQVARPETRGDTWSDELLGPYRDALATLTERPLGGWVQRTLLVEDLTALYLVESEARARPWVADALRRAIGHCVRGVLLDTIRGRDRRLAEVRLCAMEQVRRLGGPRTVALMLAVMAASPEERAAGLPPFDPDALVQLRLIHYCGQLDAEAAQQAVRLPGQEAWQTTSPAEFLARTVLSETGYYSKLRTPALVALAWCLRRPSVDPDPGWVREWLESRGA